jgi:predicted nucleic acid-binding protein
VILVDSSVWINYFNGVSTWQTDLLDHYLSNTPIIIGDLILTEILQGFRSKADFKIASGIVLSVTARFNEK